MIPLTYLSIENTNVTKTDKEGQIAMNPNFKEVSVHDPSIYKEGDTYYVFGTHVEAAKSKDLMSWERFTNGYSTPENALYGDLSKNLAESFKWAGENDADSYGGFAVWAPEIFYNKDYLNEDGSNGAYMMYYSASSTYIRSAIGIAVSQDIEGPYEYKDTVIYSGFTKEESYDENSEVNKKWDNTNIAQLIADGIVDEVSPRWFGAGGTYNNTLFPNAIDANLFYDTDGKLWMTYGSWSGGIFILELDKSNGLPIYPGKDGKTEDGRMVDRYFGTKIAGGFTKSGEGPYVIYDEETEYYYLYVTYGWLGADGGYNMRVFRSEKPDGPYVDAKGDNAVLPGDVPNHMYGNKIMGNFLFDRKIGEDNKGFGFGYLSPGHNSVLYDEDKEERHLVFHTRFPNRGEAFEVRVHSIFMNEDHWPVASPFRYTGKKLKKVNNSDIEGVYKFINHGQDYSADVNRSTYIELEKNNKITGSFKGEWDKKNDYFANVTIDNTLYKGVFIEQWDPTQKEYVMTFTAQSDQGISIWGSKQARSSDKETVHAIKEELDIGSEEVSKDLDLPKEGANGATIEWESSNPEIISSDGNVTREENDIGMVTLTATIKLGEISEQKTFELTVNPTEEASISAHYGFEGNLEESSDSFSDGKVTGIEINKGDGTISFDEGIFGEAVYLDGQSGIKLPDKLVNSYEYTISYWIKPEELSPFTTTFFGGSETKWLSFVPMGPVDDKTMLWSGEEWYDAPTSYQVEADVWTHVAFSVNHGEVKVYLNGELEFEGDNFPNVLIGNNADFAIGVNHWDEPYKGWIDELMVFNGELQSEQVEQLATVN
ncbi:LamG-like jellyroll fold domain-containing protein [Gracilibacillus halotolerans]